MSDETDDRPKLITHELMHSIAMEHTTHTRRVVTTNTNGRPVTSRVETREGRTGVPCRIRESDPFELARDPHDPDDLPF